MNNLAGQRADNYFLLLDHPNEADQKVGSLVKNDVVVVHLGIA